ncbi:hypothetical protein [Streptacidiphilus sp. P02-A3a]|nr:hypothetical protein [Streptacidiphilus sp. P02-A3a]
MAASSKHSTAPRGRVVRTYSTAGPSARIRRPDAAPPRPEA